MDERLHKLMDIINMGIDEINAKGKLENKEAACIAGELLDMRKDFATIEAMEEAGYSEMYPYYYDDGMSMNGSYGSYARGQRRDSMGRYSRNDGSYRRGSYGRSSYERGYSRNELVDHLEEMMRNATTDHEREKYRKMILDAEKD